jgi:predicted aspartyl protease
MTRGAIICGLFLAAAFLLPAKAQDPKAQDPKAQDPKACRLDRFSVLPISTLSDGRFTVPVDVNGQKLDFEVDTGGTTATIEGNQAHWLQLTPLLARGMRLSGVAGNALNYYTVINKFSLGQLQGTNFTAYLDNRLVTGADGTLSPDMMRHYDVDIDMLRGTLSLFSQQHCAGQVVYWTRSGYVVLPMKVEKDGHIRVPVTIDGAQFTAFLDTGAIHTLISMHAAKQIGISENSPDLKLAAGNAKYKMYDYPFKLMDFNGVSVSTPRIQVVTDGFLPADMDVLVGISLLRRLHLYIAYGEEKLYITPAQAN